MRSNIAPISEHGSGHIFPLLPRSSVMPPLSKQGVTAKGPWQHVLTGIVVELNPSGRLSLAQMQRALDSLAREVIPTFR